MRRAFSLNVLLVLGFLCAAARARAREQEPLFLSITRRADPMEKLPTNISVVTDKEIKQLGAKTLDEVLDMLPSIDLAKTGSLGSFTTLRMRGVPTSAHVQVLVDEQPVSGTAFQLVDI